MSESKKIPVAVLVMGGLVVGFLGVYIGLSGGIRLLGFLPLNEQQAAVIGFCAAVIGFGTAAMTLYGKMIHEMLSD